MTRPSCSVMEQKVQPPKQPRIVHDRVLHRLERGDRARAYDRVRRAVERQVVELVHRRAVGRAASAGGLK